jgi:hypothetical protein
MAGDGFSWRDAQQVEWTDEGVGIDPGAPYAWVIEGADVSHASRDPADYLPTSPDDPDPDRWINLGTMFAPMFRAMREAHEHGSLDGRVYVEVLDPATREPIGRFGLRNGRVVASCEALTAWFREPLHDGPGRALRPEDGIQWFYASGRPLRFGPDGIEEPWL